jgi:hypothetical protein
MTSRRTGALSVHLAWDEVLRGASAVAGPEGAAANEGLSDFTSSRSPLTRKRVNLPSLLCCLIFRPTLNSVFRLPVTVGAV